MPSYTVHQAKTHFSRLLKEAEAGREVIVMRGDQAVARLVPIESSKEEKKEPFRLLGAYRGKISWDEDAFDPMTDEELKGIGWGYMVDAPLVSSPESGKE